MIFSASLSTSYIAISLLTRGIVFVINPLTVERNFKDILIEAALLIARLIHWETIASLGAMVKYPRGFNTPDFIDFVSS